jgi:hypothetical protein
MKIRGILYGQGAAAMSGEFGGMAASERWATVSNGSTRCKLYIGARFSGPAAESKGFVEVRIFSDELPEGVVALPNANA